MKETGNHQQELLSSKGIFLPSVGELSSLIFRAIPSCGTQQISVQSAEAAEYTDCIFAER